jgi:hypothetical protein
VIPARYCLCLTRFGHNYTIVILAWDGGMDWRIGAALHLEPDADLPFSVEYVREDGTRCHELLLACAGERSDRGAVREIMSSARPLGPLGAGVSVHDVVGRTESSEAPNTVNERADHLALSAACADGLSSRKSLVPGLLR